MRLYTDPGRFTFDESGRVRVEVVSAEGVEVFPGVIGADPAVAKPNIGKLGWCEEDAEVPGMPGYLNPRITLDDGTVIWGYQCWWKPIEKSH